MYFSIFVFAFFCIEFLNSKMKPPISSCLFTCPSPTGKSCCSFHCANICKLMSFPKRSAPCEIFLTSFFFFNALSMLKLWRVLQPCIAVWDYGIMPGESTAAAKLLQSCPTLCDHIDGLLPGSSVPGILQARTLEWVAISFSNAWKWKVKVKSLSRVRLLATSWTAAYQAPPSMGFSRQESWHGVPLLSPKIMITNLYNEETT